MLKRGLEHHDVHLKDVLAVVVVHHVVGIAGVAAIAD
jgi:hypothetical protein